MKENLTNNCLKCLYSEYTEINLLINDFLGNDCATCNHKNSPYYDEHVTDNHSCRLFIDSEKYFKQQDRKEKLDNIKNMR